MANKPAYPANCTLRGVRVLAFTFAPNGSDAITLGTTAKQAGVSSVARTGTGAFTITLSERYQELVSASFQLQLATPAAALFCVDAVDVSSAKTITFKHYAESAGTFAAADIAANAENLVRVVLYLRNQAAY